MFEISLIAETGSEDKTLEKFKSTFPQMEMVEYRQRDMIDKSSYIYLKLIPHQHSATNLRRGRPLNLTYEQIVYAVTPEPSARTFRATLPHFESHFHGVESHKKNEPARLITKRAHLSKFTHTCG